MTRGILALLATTMLGVALVQDAPDGGASLELATEPAQSLVNVTGPAGFMSLLDLSGSETLTGLEPGRYFIAATARGHHTSQLQIELAEGARESVTLTLQPLDSGADSAGGANGADADSPAGGADAGAAEDEEDGQGAQDGNGGQSESAEEGGQQGQQEGQQEGQQGADNGQAGQDGEASGGGQAASSEQGQQIFSQQCAQCHGQEGEGGTGPALAGNDGLQDAQMVVTQIIEGGGGMPAFGDQLSDEEIAAVATHEMNSWGNEFGEVSADQVSQVREGGEISQDGQGQDGQGQDGQGQDGQDQDGQDQQGQAQDGQAQEGQGQAGQQASTAGGAQAGDDQVHIQITMPAGAAPMTFTIDVRSGAADGAGQGDQPASTTGGAQMGDGQMAEDGRPGEGGDQAAQGDAGEEGEDQQQEGEGEGGDSTAGGGDQASQAQEGEGQQGWFAQAQANSGSQAYFVNCAACHGGGLEGRPPYPPVAGEEFLANWEGSTLRELYEYISSEMPDDRPGELDQSTYEHVTAYILQQNGFPSGNELDGDADDLDELVIGGGQGQQTGDSSTDDEDAQGQDDQQQDGQDGQDGEGEEPQGGQEGSDSQPQGQNGGDDQQQAQEGDESEEQTQGGGE